jgi:imidazole glycerol phosphate synthase glutamine amidotransferase subunit
MIVIVDYGAGNLLSVEKAVLSLGEKPCVTDAKAKIMKAKKIIFPGVAHFGSAVRELTKRKIFSLLKAQIQEGVPFFGICLGMQLLFEESEEAPGIKGLAAIRGKVRRFKGGLIVPHMGWNQVTITTSPFRLRSGQAVHKVTGLFEGIEDNSYFYFAHSYYCVPKGKGVIAATTKYGAPFVSAVHKGNVWGIQFHPEKSQHKGLKVLENFLKVC